MSAWPGTLPVYIPIPKSERVAFGLSGSNCYSTNSVSLFVAFLCLLEDLRDLSDPLDKLDLAVCAEPTRVLFSLSLAPSGSWSFCLCYCSAGYPPWAVSFSYSSSSYAAKAAYLAASSSSAFCFINSSTSEPNVSFMMPMRVSILLYLSFSI